MNIKQRLFACALVMILVCGVITFSSAEPDAAGDGARQACSAAGKRFGGVGSEHRVL